MAQSRGGNAARDAPGEQRAQVASSQWNAAEQGWSTRPDAGNRAFELISYLNSPLTLQNY